MKPKTASTVESDNRRETIREIARHGTELHLETLSALADEPKPWWENLSDEDQEALGAMLMTMRPRNDYGDKDGA